jgi:hypothetical protein
MAAQSRRGGCGCCGCLLAFLLILFALTLLGIGSVYFVATAKLNGVSRTGPVVVLPGATFTRQTYISARQKLNQFFADPSERRLTLSSAEVNALLADSPEVRKLSRGTTVVLNQNSAEVSCSVPVALPFLPRHYLNSAFLIRPSMHGDQLILDVSKIEGKGAPLGAAGIQQYQRAVVALIEQTVSMLNKVQGDRSVHEARIENGNLVLAR